MQKSKQRPDRGGVYQITKCETSPSLMLQSTTRKRPGSDSQRWCGGRENLAGEGQGWEASSPDRLVMMKM